MLGDGGEEGAEARDALELIETRARQGKKWDTVVEVLLGKIEHAQDEERAQHLLELAAVYETEVGDLQRAFEAVTTACQIAPGDDIAAARAEKLAAATGGWAGLVAEASEIATEAKDPVLASKWWARLGTWYATKLDRADYALPSLRRAVELDPKNGAAYPGLAEAHRRQQKWAELADALRAHADVETDIKIKSRLLCDLGDLLETQLASSAKAIDAYSDAAEIACEANDNNVLFERSLTALERLLRRSEDYVELARVLDRRAEVAEEGGDASRAAAIRRELATLRAEKLGDLEGAIQRYEAAVAANGSDATALKALVELYDKTGRTEDYLRTMERLGQVAPEGEKLATLRKLAAELEDRDPTRSGEAYERLLAVDPSADDAYRGLERTLRVDSHWTELVDVFKRHIAAAKTPALRSELYLESAQILERELHDAPAAIDAMMNVLAIDDSNKTAL